MSIKHHHLKKPLVQLLNIQLVKLVEFNISKFNISKMLPGTSLRNGVLFVLAWVARVACLRGWRGKSACMGSVLAWMTWVACLCGWRASMGGMGGVGGVFTWVACYYYCFCYY